MQRWFDNNDVLMYSAHNEGKSVITEKFINTLKAKIYKKMRADDGKSYFSYLNKLIDQYNNENLLMLVIMFWLKNYRRILKLLNLK